MKTPSASTLDAVLLEVYSSLDTPVSLACWLMHKYGVRQDLVAKTVDPMHYLDTVSGAILFGRDYRAVKFMSKFDDESYAGYTQDVLVQKAIAAFDDGEKQCASTNEFLRNLATWDPLASESGVVRAARDLLAQTKKMMARLLGPVPAAIHPRFGPGTTAELMGLNSFSTVLDKLSSTPCVTRAATPVFRWWYDRTTWSLARARAGQPHLAEWRGSTFFTVPKNATSVRGCCAEPGGNVMLQLGTGGHIKGRLERWGIHVGKKQPLDPHVWTYETSRSKGQLVHQKIALESSLSGRFCTIDLRNASNNMAYELVRYTTPDEWFMLLDSLRSPYTQVVRPGGPVWTKLEMFSSMGNGFTFELMTSILLCALCTGLQRRAGEEVWVYGDDIIVPTEDYQKAVAIIELLGFNINPTKSYATGPFRESCGMDAFAGHDVTATKLRKQSLEDVDAIYGLHNTLVRRGFAFSPSVLAEVRELLPRALRHPGPRWVANTLHGWKWTPQLRRSVKDPILKERVPGCPYTLWVRSLTVHGWTVPLERWDSDVVHLYAIYGGMSELIPRKFSTLRRYGSGWTSVS